MNRGKRLDIQALRAIAVVSVVIYHFWPNSLTGGFMGVDIFFVISGYLMTMTLMRDAQPVLTAKKKLRATWSFLTNFYARRIKRLIPAASITLLATLGLGYLTGNLALLQETARQITASTLFMQNWYLANNSVDYLANTNPTAVQHFWSLSLEEQFYLVWPLLLLAMLLVFAHLYITYKKTKVANLAIIPISLMVVAFFAYGYFLTKSEPALAYFVTPARVWELLIGAVLAFLPVLKNYDLRLLLPWVGVGMIGYALYQWDGSNFPGWHALVPTLGTALIIYAGGMAGESKWSFEQILRFRPIQWLGNISYSLYLWHWPLIILLPVIFTINLDSHPLSFFIKLGILTLALVISHLSFRYIELGTQRIALKKRYVYASFIAIVGIVASISLFTVHRVDATIQQGVKDARAIALNDKNECFGAKSVLNNCDKSFGYATKEFAQIGSSDKYDFLLNQQEFCSSYSANKYTSRVGDFCVVGDLNSEREITIWGDSHAQQWINPMDKIGRENNIKVNIIGTSYCFGSTQYKKTCDIRYEKLKENGVFDRSESIIIATWHSKYLKNDGNNAVEAFDVLRSLTTNDNLYFIEDTPPSGPEGGPECSALHQACKHDATQALKFLSQGIDALLRLEVISANRIIYINDIFCDENYCYSNIGGVPVYRDKSNSTNSHLTASFAYSTWPILEQKLKEVGAIK